MQELPSLESHPVVGAPLQLATKLGHEGVVRAMLKSLSAALNDKQKTEFVRSVILLDRSESYYADVSQDKGFAIAPAVYTAIAQNDENILDLLVKWYKYHGFTFFKPSYNHFLQTAISKSSLAVVQAVLKIPYLNHGTAKKVNWTHFQKACSAGRADVVQLFLDDCYIAANDKMSVTSPLAEAARSDFPAIIKILVDAGADFNQESVWRSRNVLSITIMVNLRNFETIRYLLEVGSSWPHISDWPTDKRSRLCYEILREAKVKEAGDKGLPCSI